MQIFISYAEEDYDIAEKIYSSLKRIPDVFPWLDKKKLLPGSNQQEEILNAIEKSQIIILLLSNNAVDKKGYFHIQIKKAIKQFEYYPPGKIFLIPARICDCNPKYRELKKLIYVDLFPDWDKGIEKIFEVVDFVKKQQKKRKFPKEHTAQTKMSLQSLKTKSVKGYKQTSSKKKKVISKKEAISKSTIQPPKFRLWRIALVRNNIEDYIFEPSSRDICIYEYLKDITDYEVYYKHFVPLNFKKSEPQLLEYLFTQEDIDHHLIFGCVHKLLVLTIARLMIYCIDSNEYIPLRIDWAMLFEEGDSTRKYRLDYWINRSLSSSQNINNSSNYLQYHQWLLTGDISCLPRHEKEKILFQINQIRYPNVKVVITDMAPEYNYQKLWPQAHYWIPLQEYVSPNFCLPSIDEQIQHIENLICYDNIASSLIAWGKIAAKYSEISWMQKKLVQILYKIYHGWLERKTPFLLLPAQIRDLRECWQKLQRLNPENWQGIYHWLDPTANIYDGHYIEGALMLLVWKKGSKNNQENWVIVNVEPTDVQKIGEGIWSKVHSNNCHILERLIKNYLSGNREEKLAKVRHCGFADLSLSSEAYEPTYAELAYFIYVTAELFNWELKGHFAYIGNIGNLLGDQNKSHHPKFYTTNHKIPCLYAALFAVVSNRPDIQSIVLSSYHLEDLNSLPGIINKDKHIFLWCIPGNNLQVTLYIISSLFDFIQNQNFHLEKEIYKFSEILEYSKEDASIRKPKNLPPRYYHKLIGREDHVKNILNKLSSHSSLDIIAITGLGGIGKTALAYEIAEQACLKTRYKGVIWESAKYEELEGVNISPTRSSSNLS